MTWRPIDCHAHTTMSDGALSVAALVAAAGARGVRPSVSDHLSGDVAFAVKTVAGVRAYLDELERYEVGRGGEFCWHDTLWRDLPDELVARFTHRIGSLHAVYPPGASRYIHMFATHVPDGLTADAYMEIHLDNLERFAREMPVDILAHVTLVPLPFRPLPPEDLWTEEREERAIVALARAGIAMEVSSRYRPHERLIARAHAAGLRLSLGSDGHSPEQVGDIAFSLALTRRIGVRDEDLYDPFVHGSRVEEARRTTAVAQRARG